MNRFGLIAGLAIAVLLPAGAIADDQHVIAQPDSLKWTAAPPVLLKGAQIAALYGHPDKAEPFVFRLKFPAGYKVAAHMHPTRVLRPGVGAVLALTRASDPAPSLNTRSPAATPSTSASTARASAPTRSSAFDQRPLRPARR